MATKNAHVNERRAAAIDDDHHPRGLLQGVFLTEDVLMAADKKQNVMFCAQLADAFPTLPNHLRAPRSSKSGARGGGIGGNGGGGNRPFSSSYHSRDGSSTAASSMYTSSPNDAGKGGASSSGRRAVGSSSAPPPVPSPPKSRWGFGFNTTRGAGAEEDGDVGEGKIYYDSDGEVESAPGCGLGGFYGLFSCISRN